MRTSSFTASAIVVLLTACSGEDPQATPSGSGGSGGGGDGSCSPAEATFESEVLPVLERKCHKCHGDEPDFGAPFSLTDFDTITGGAKGTRLVDRMVPALTEFIMPPPGNPQLTQAELDALLDWASCGTAEADTWRGLESSRPIWESPAEPSPGLRLIPLVANEFPVAAGSESYESFYFENVVDEDLFIRRFDVIIDESRVVHHVTAHYTDDNRYLYAWAPGTGAVEFPDGGLRIRPTDRFRIEIHYNNGANLQNVRDSSGIAFYVAEAQGTEYAMADPTTFAIAVPPRAESTATAECTPTHDFRIVASMPHMHQIGKSFRHEVIRADGTVEPIITLENWSFELQYFYDTPVTVNAGDRMKLTCTYQNPTDETVIGGVLTTDEMCYNFMFITPPEASGDCSLSH